MPTTNVAPLIPLPATLEFPDRSVSAPDPDASAVPRYVCQGIAQTVRIGATSDTASATLSGRLYLLDSQGVPLGVLSIQFTAGPAADWGTVFTATAPGGDPCWPLGGAKYVAFKIDAVSAGNWTIRGALG